MKTRTGSAITAGIALFCWCTTVDAVEIKGTVRSATADAATIAIEGESAPNAGDPVEIYFRLPGADAEISVGSGKVTAVRDDSVEARIDKATGTVSKDQLARITSDKPKKRSGTAAQSPATVPPDKQTVAGDGRNPGFAFVDLNKIFKEYPKTKAAEAKINEKKNAAKEEYDARAKDYRKALDEVNALDRKITAAPKTEQAQLASERDDKIATIKEMERSIKEFSDTRQKELQDDTMKMRNEIVAEITGTLQRLSAQNINLLLDLSAQSASGNPVVLHFPSEADMSERVSSALEKKAPSPFKAMRPLEIATVDVYRVYKSHNKAKPLEAKIAEAKNAKTEYDQRQLQYMSKNMHEIIVGEIMAAVNARITAESSPLLLNKGATCRSGLPFVMFSSGVPDHADEVIATVNGSGANNQPSSTAWLTISSAKVKFGTFNETRIADAVPDMKSADAVAGKPLPELTVEKIKGAVAQAAGKAGLNVVFNTTGQTLNGVPLFLLSRNLPDITEDVVAKLK
ncbi:MAG TPA: OmpH family outer membrane protein [Candidatus Binatia bacterium]